jgi:hypothetical protein
MGCTMQQMNEGEHAYEITVDMMVMIMKGNPWIVTWPC